METTPYAVTRMKTSLRRKQASRANGARSRGPKTVEGKARSSYNAVRHGMLADCLLLPGEDRSVFAALMAEFVERFQPLDGVELGLVEEMAACHWRLRRNWSAESELIAQAMDRQAPATPRAGRRNALLGNAFKDLAAAPELHLLNRYETRLHRMYQRALRNLLDLRETRRAEAQDAVDSKVDALPEEPESADFRTNLIPFPDAPPSPQSAAPIRDPRPAEPGPHSDSRPGSAPEDLS